jgi:hypothetical protein
MFAGILLSLLHFYESSVDMLDGEHPVPTPVVTGGSQFFSGILQGLLSRQNVGWDVFTGLRYRETTHTHD